MTTYLIDSNIIVYAFNITSPYHQQAKEFMNRQVLTERVDCCVAYQTIYEFYAIITDGKRVERPLDRKRALGIIELFISSNNLKKIFLQRTNLSNVLKIVRNYNITSQNIFDAVLVATMLDNRVTGIYTSNERHFNKFKFLEVINPFNE